MDNFDLKQFLVENKITTQSRLNEDEEKRGFYVTMKPKDGSYGKSTLTNLPNHANQTYSGALQSIERLKAVDGKKGKKYTYYVSDIDGNPLDKDGNIINEESKLNENEEQEAVDFLNQHKKEIFDRFNIKDNYGVSEKKFMNGYFESSGPFIFHNVEGYDDSSIEFTLLPNEERNTGMFTQTEVKIGGKKFYLTGVKNY